MRNQEELQLGNLRKINIYVIYVNNEKLQIIIKIGLKNLFTVRSYALPLFAIGHHIKSKKGEGRNFSRKIYPLDPVHRTEIILALVRDTWDDLSSSRPTFISSYRRDSWFLFFQCWLLLMKKKRTANLLQKNKVNMRRSRKICSCCMELYKRWGMKTWLKKKFLVLS